MAYIYIYIKRRLDILFYNFLSHTTIIFNLEQFEWTKDKLVPEWENNMICFTAIIIDERFVLRMRSILLFNKKSQCSSPCRQCKMRKLDTFYRKSFNELAKQKVSRMFYRCCNKILWHGVHIRVCITDLEHSMFY